ncbi:MAG: cell envelope integrity protein TolA [Gammaproteobacteria bacterium]|nr:MAG: cell envelope integrity protein TolA [Gammaproteobacteria bacterium]
MRSDRSKRRGHGVSLPFLLSVAVHLALLSVLVLNFSLSSKPMGAKKNLSTEPIIQAKAVDEQKIQQVVEQIKAKEEKKKQEELERKKELKELEQKRQQEEQRLQELEKKKEIEKKELSELAEKKKLEEQQRKEAEEKRKAEDQKRKEAEEKRKAEDQKRKEAEKKREAEEKKKAEKLKKEQEKKKKAEALQKREAEKKRKAAEAKKARQALERRADAEFNRYAARIQAKVESNWRYSGQQCLTAKVLVQLAPGGVVRNVRVIRGSGDPVFDRSVEAAFLRASPLPLPPDPQLFEFYREIEFLFNPCG